MSDGVGSKIEDAKATSRQLRGTIADELRNPAPVLSADNYLLLKFHGTYQQDNGDVRAERRRHGLGPEHICMVRVSIPGGILTPEQYLVMDKLCDAVGNGSLRITSRQGIRFHYDIHLGGETVGLRMNQVFCESVPRDEVANVLRAVSSRYRESRRVGERFGDLCHRVDVDELRAELGTEQWVRTPTKWPGPAASDEADEATS